MFLRLHVMHAGDMHLERYELYNIEYNENDIERN